MNGALNISSSPHARDRWTTAFVMRAVIVAMLPTAIMGVIFNGLYAALVILLAVATAVGAEFAYDRLCHKPDTWKDGSAAVTGLMLALSLSPTVPLYAPVIGSLFAILVVKCAFGGLGKNFINPALAARCFLLISFGRAMSTFQVDGVTAATPVALLLTGQSVDVTEMFFTASSGVIGSCIFTLLLGGMALWTMDIIHGEICFSVLGGFTLIMGLFGGHGFDPKFLIAHLCGGGVVMGAFFMATDYVTSPVSRLGQMIFGLFIGVLGALFSLFGTTADSFSYSIIIANLLVPLIDTFIIPKPFAYRRSAIRRREGDTRGFFQRIPRAVIVLTAITLVAGLALGAVYGMTKDTIDEQKRVANARSYQAVLPEATSFSPDADVDAAIAGLNGAVWGEDMGRVYIEEAMTGYGEGGETVGHVVRVTSADGFDGNLTLVVGIDAAGTITKVAFTEINETPGMGMRAQEPEFIDQFSGRAAQKLALYKQGASDNAEDGIDAISGATITSTAVTNAVNAGLDFFHTVIEPGTKEE